MSDDNDNNDDEKHNIFDWRSKALPANTQELYEQRKSMRVRSLNDDVEECHLKLWADLNYRKLFIALWPSETMEGSFPCDDQVAATMIRAFAVENNIPIAAHAKLHSIVKSLAVVCRRYKMTRNERRNRVGNQEVGTRPANKAQPRKPAPPTNTDEEDEAA